MNSWIRRTIGAVFLGGFLVSGFVFSKPLRESNLLSDFQNLSLFSKPKTTNFADPVGRLRPLDPIFHQSAEGDWNQVGYVSSRVDDASLALVWFDTDVPIDQCSLFQHYDTGSLENVVTTMFPPEKQSRIKAKISDAVSAHGKELSRAFVPLVRKTLQDSLPIVEEEFREAVRRHRASIDKLARSWNKEIVDKRLVPLAKKELLPIVQKHGQPVAEKIGRKIWDKASIFRFGWRAIYDKAPLPQKNLLQEEWDRFLKDEAIPIFEAHTKEMVTAVQRTVRDVTNNRAVRSELANVMDDLADDPEARKLVRTILQETLLDNDRVKKVWRDVWTSKDAQAAMNLASSRLEPIVRKIGDEIFGTEETGIDPGFARVLRSQILGKDRRWIVAYDVGVETEKTILRAKKTMPFPVVYLADGESEQQP